VGPRYVHARVAVTHDRSAVRLVTLYAEIGRELAQPADRSDALTAVTRVAVVRVPGVEWASISEGRNGTFATVAATDEGACAVDAIQYELGTGPCVDAIREDVTFRTGDLLNDSRWPQFGQRASETHHVHSMLSFRLYLEDDDRIAGLNLYSTEKDAFDDEAETVGSLVATHGALAIAAASAREHAAHLRRALETNREIGMAMGVLMTTYKCTRRQAFDLLRIASQNTNRKLVDVAIEVTDTGTLDLPGSRASRDGSPT
jgi:transcriptional regulator with GAF, ATPase, and Fis domain